MNEIVSFLLLANILNNLNWGLATCEERMLYRNDLQRDVHKARGGSPAP